MSINAKHKMGEIMRYVIKVECENEQDKYILSCCEQDIRNKLEGERDSLRVTVANLQAENGWLTSRLLRADCVVQHDGSFFLEDVPEMLAREFDLLKQENKRLRQVCAEAVRKISEDVRDLGPCGRKALTDVYIMLNEAANGGGE